MRIEKDVFFIVDIVNPQGGWRLKSILKYRFMPGVAVGFDDKRRFVRVGDGKAAENGCGKNIQNPAAKQDQLILPEQKISYMFRHRDLIGYLACPVVSRRFVFRWKPVIFA